MVNSKIKTLDELQQITTGLKSEGKKVVHCHGVFDLLHIGHIKHFEEARSLGDCLVVTITPDGYVNKGPNRTAFTTALISSPVLPMTMVSNAGWKKPWTSTVMKVICSL